MRTMMRFLLVGAMLLTLAWIVPGQAGAPPQTAPAAALRLRRPIALILVDGGKRLLIANRDSGTVAVVDTQKRRVIAETRVGRKLSDMTATPKRDLVLVTDEEGGAVVVLAYRQGTLRELRRIPVGLSPVSAQVSDGGLASVACLWPRRLVILDPSATRKPALAVLDLPFAPRRQLLVPGTSRTIVADAFGGGLAVVDLARKQVASVRHFAVHNIRGLALDRAGKHLLLTHQVLHGRGRTTTGDITTSNLITNNVRKLSLAAILDPQADVLRGEQFYAVGDVERGAGDPAEVVETRDGQLLVALAGVNEVALGKPGEVIWTRLAVGRRPTALAIDDTMRRAYVANTLDDSISVVDLQAAKVIGEIRLAPALDLRPEERGELLFYDARLSHDAWFSCHSCHPDGHTNGLLNDNFSDGSFGTPKRVLSLFGVKDTGPWAWNGQMPHLETQVRTSLKSTMQGPTPSVEQVRDLTAFLRTLPPPPALLKARGALDAEALKRGRKIFARQKCAACHTPPAYTSPKAYDVGLRDELGGKLFNPPSLRGVSQGGPYFHDNRGLTLEDVFARHRHQLSGTLSAEELRDLLYYLRSL